MLSVIFSNVWQPCCRTKEYQKATRTSIKKIAGGRVKMDDLLLIAVLGDIKDVEDAMISQILKKRNTQRIRSLEFPRFNLETMPSEDCSQNFRFQKNDLPRLMVALGIPTQMRIRDRTISGLDALCIYLRRLAYPNRLCDLERLFGLSGPYLSLVCTSIMQLINKNFGHLLDNLKNILWLNKERFVSYSNAVSSSGAPIKNCWGFIDGTARPICRPSVNQEMYFSGHKRFHCVKYQSVVCPDGIIVSLKGSFPGRMHDAGILRRSDFYEELQQCAKFADGQKFVLYGDAGNPIRELLLRPYSRNNLTPEQSNFNSVMSSVRLSVEWGFGKIVNEFAFLDFKKNQTLMLQDVENMYRTAVLLTNCHTCIYGGQCQQIFQISPPSLEEYLSQNPNI